MANTLEYSKIFQPVLDKQVVQESTTGWMEANAGQVKYNGGDEVKIPSMIMDGLGDYNRQTGYVDGDVTLTWDTHKLTQDRGRRFHLDAMEVDETNFVATAGSVMGEFQRTQVIPEIDAFRYSKIATLAKDAGNSRDIELTEANALDELFKDLATLEDKIGEQNNVIVTLSPLMIELLASNERFKNLTSESVLKQGGLDLRLAAVNGNALRKVASKLFKSKFVFQDGKTGGQEKGGFVTAEGAQDINWLITTQDAPIAVSKTDTVRVFDPLTNQSANAWRMDYRKFHDLWIPKNKLEKVYVNFKPTVGG
ncbi:hypothetical protein M2909_04310 [Vagococcus lutrae]|uniref:hypothetical protein n=1 Tax=Vagococcus lutrae TaxID=81947 RepID=UPI0020105C2E|nr:hypothetical protein [Vagococcus lutrae]UQF24217.1 hypothetical protein M2909_04310 [Vagococcus lutrae]UQF63693.1 hypothetical protein M2908_07405 [Vagococcus lutrae]